MSVHIDSSGMMTSAIMNAPYAPVKAPSAMTARIGLLRFIARSQNFVHSPAPSMSAASKSSRGRREARSHATIIAATAAPSGSSGKRLRSRNDGIIETSPGKAIVAMQKSRSW